MTQLTTTVRSNGSPKTYKRLAVASAVLGGVALGAGSALERPLLAVGLYLVGMLGALVIPQATERTLFDERDDSVHRRASGFTLALFGWLAALVFPSLVVLSGTDHFSWGPASATLAWTTLGVYAVYGLAVGYYGRR